MIHGEVAAIFITSKGKAPLEPHDAVRAVPGRGLEGDRYFNGTGTFSNAGKLPESQEISLIESEAIDALAREKSIKLLPADARRNVLTRGVALNHLVGREFTVGAVRLRGIKLCEPCGHLEGLTQSGVKSGLVHRGGLRAQILTEGVIRVGDAIAAALPARSAGVRVMVIGASNDKAKFGNRAVRAYLQQKHEVVPVNPNHEHVEGQQAYGAVGDVPGFVDRALFYVPPEVGLEVIEELGKRGEVGEVWLNPGAESPKLIARARRLGFRTITGCAIIDIGEMP